MANADTVVTLDLGDTATAGSSGDYKASWSPTSKQLTIPSGTASSSAPVTLTVTPRQDSVVEGDETIVVEGTAQVSNPDRKCLVGGGGAGHAEDDDSEGV